MAKILIADLRHEQILIKNRTDKIIENMPSDCLYFELSAKMLKSLKANLKKCKI